MEIGERLVWVGNKNAPNVLLTSPIGSPVTLRPIRLHTGV